MSFANSETWPVSPKCSKSHLWNATSWLQRIVTEIREPQNAYNKLHNMISETCDKCFHTKDTPAAISAKSPGLLRALEGQWKRKINYMLTEINGFTLNSNVIITNCIVMNWTIWYVKQNKNIIRIYLWSPVKYWKGLWINVNIDQLFGNLKEMCLLSKTGYKYQTRLTSFFVNDDSKLSKALQNLRRTQRISSNIQSMNIFALWL